MTIRLTILGFEVARIDLDTDQDQPEPIMPEGLFSRLWNKEH